MDGIHLSIQCLREIADSIDKTHKYCTIATIAANSGSATAGILSILGLTLTGGSLMLSAAGMGLGTMAGITGVPTAVSKHVINSKELERAERLITKCQKSLKKLYIPIELISKLNALKIVQANPALKALAKQAAATGSTSRKTISDVRKVFSGTPLAMTKGARILGAASLGLFLLLDAYSIGQDAKHLKEGAKAETAAEIREKYPAVNEESTAFLKKSECNSEFLHSVGCLN
uniref:Apolipoprotein L3 n=1 Tax=Anolis carolinensis TaxID=28377 RepID=A0A803SPR3_ANOCA